MSKPPAVFLPLMTEPQPDTADRVRRDVLSIEFAIPKIERLEYIGKPTVFRFSRPPKKEDECAA